MSRLSRRLQGSRLSRGLYEWLPASLGRRPRLDGWSQGVGVVKPLRAVAASLVTERTMLLSFSVQVSAMQHCHPSRHTYRYPGHFPHGWCPILRENRKWGSIGPRIREYIRRSRLHGTHGHRRTEGPALRGEYVRGVLHRQHIRCQQKFSHDDSGSGQPPSRRPYCHYTGNEWM